MSPVFTLMIFGWIATGLMVGFCALNESGKLLKYHHQIGTWLKWWAPPAVQAELPDSVRIDAA
jgi:hypothetical protein